MRLNPHFWFHRYSQLSREASCSYSNRYMFIVQCMKRKIKGAALGVIFDLLTHLELASLPIEGHSQCVEGSKLKTTLRSISSNYA